MTGAAQSAVAGQRLATAPTFVVSDANGSPLGNVAVTIATSAGSVSGAPTRTLAGPTSVGAWTLGEHAGADTMTVSVHGLTPLVIVANAMPGAAAKIVTTAPISIAGRVGDVGPSINARVTDAFGNPIALAAVNVALAGGGSAPSNVTSDANGDFTVSGWQYSTIAGQNILTVSSAQATLSFTATLSPADPSQVLVSGADQKGRAGAAVSPIVVKVADKYGNAIAGRSATFAVTAGGGSIAATSATAGSDGSIAMPAWTLGRTTLPQVVHVVSGTLSTDVNVTVASDYKIDIRFFGPNMTDAQQALFTTAAARLQSIVTGDIPDIAVSGLDVSAACGMTGLPTISENIDDLVIYASVQPIDGAGKILAEAGPCVFRNDAQGGFSAVGVMLFDVADLDKMTAQGTLQDVITHEMLHVLGVGTMWSAKNLVAATGTVNVGYYGALGRQGCIDDGGTSTCFSNVPVENSGGAGTADSHWRETTFGSELMTGYVNLGGMPLSAITVGSLSDLGYVVNPLSADPYSVPTIGASGELIPLPGASSAWERVTPSAVVLGASPGAAPRFIRR
ncbi:MAG TPA: leishmanolysin-related zinc metalloendopeptidase [Gemmatimonadaceae bacterium]|nr:leishmanolysin-related zinc metalloendopeptidase [Gemmatimonadaceae bacterium]